VWSGREGVGRRVSRRLYGYGQFLGEVRGVVADGGDRMNPVVLPFRGSVLELLEVDFQEKTALLWNFAGVQFHLPINLPVHLSVFLKHHGSISSKGGA
jgi:hypothetical protein